MVFRFVCHDGYVEVLIEFCFCCRSSNSSEEIRESGKYINHEVVSPRNLEIV